MKQLSNLNGRPGLRCTFVPGLRGTLRLLEWRHGSDDWRFVGAICQAFYLDLIRLQ